MKSVEGPIVCNPVDFCAKRGPHNCGKCDSAVAEAIRKQALSQDTGVFLGLECNCRAAWRKVIDMEYSAFVAPLI